MSSFSITALTKSGSSVLNFTKEELKAFSNQLSDIGGHVLVTITPIQEKGTELQIYKLYNVIVPIFCKLALMDGGEILTHEEALDQLLFTVCKFERKGSPEDVLYSLSVSDLSRAIDESKLWLNEFYNAEIL